MLFQKCAVYIQLDFYFFITITGSIPLLSSPGQYFCYHPQVNTSAIIPRSQFFYTVMVYLIYMYLCLKFTIPK